jgi:EF-hand domain pair/EF hand
MSGMSALSGGIGGSNGLAALQDRLFARIDANGNGQISPNELAVFEQNLPGADGASGNSPQVPFNKIDTNGDGSISLAEFQDFGQQQTQANAALLQMQEQSGVQGAQHRHHHHHHGASAPGQAQSSDPSALFNQIDTNKDGSISASEWASAFGSGGATTVAGGTQAAANATDPLQALLSLNTLV